MSNDRIVLQEALANDVTAQPDFYINAEIYSGAVVIKTAPSQAVMWLFNGAGSGIGVTPSQAAVLGRLLTRFGETHDDSDDR